MDERLKKRLLAGAVDDNLRAIRNEPRQRLHRRAPFPWWLAATGSALVLGALAFVWSWRGAESAAPPPVTAGTAPSGVTLATGSAARLVAGPPVRVSAGVFPLAVRRIALDPGHGGGDLGTRTPTGLTEKFLTLDIAGRLADRLTGAGFEVRLTRPDDRRVSLADRAKIANEAGADLYVSIHVNWIQDGRANRGIETFYLGPSDDPWVTRLASEENRESGYSLADVRRLLESIYADLRQEQSRSLARSVQSRLVSSIRQVAPEVADRGVKSAPFLVLTGTEMPAILAEVACLSNEDEARLLGQADYRDRIARALFEGIAAYSRAVAQTDPPGSGDSAAAKREVR